MKSPTLTFEHPFEGLKGPQALVALTRIGVLVAALAALLVWTGKPLAEVLLTVTPGALFLYLVWCGACEQIKKSLAAQMDPRPWGLLLNALGENTAWCLLAFTTGNPAVIVRAAGVLPNALDLAVKWHYSGRSTSAALVTVILVLTLLPVLVLAAFYLQAFRTIQLLSFSHVLVYVMMGWALWTRFRDLLRLRKAPLNEIKAMTVSVPWIAAATAIAFALHFAFSPNYQDWVLVAAFAATPVLQVGRAAIIRKRQRECE